MLCHRLFHSSRAERIQKRDYFCRMQDVENKWDLRQRHIRSIRWYRVVKNFQNLDGGVFAGRSWDVHSLDVRRVIEVDQFFRDLWTSEKCGFCFGGTFHSRSRWWTTVCVLLTVSLFMKPQIAAATSQANRITKKKKN